MAPTTTLSLILLALTPLFLHHHHTLAQTPSAPAPAPDGPLNVTGILDKGQQFTTFIRLMASTQVASQIENQINNSRDGMTIFAPTDNAFNSLKAGALNGLNAQEQVELIQYHILPKFYTLSNLLLVSNPVRTQANDWGLNFTGEGSQVNVSSGLVVTQVNNPLRQVMPLAVYTLDKVLLPNDLFGTKPPGAAPTPKTSSSSNGSKVPSSEEPTASDSNDKSGSGERKTGGLGFVLGFALLCMGSFLN